MDYGRAPLRSRDGVGVAGTGGSSVGGPWLPARKMHCRCRAFRRDAGPGRDLGAAGGSGQADWAGWGGKQGPLPRCSGAVDLRPGRPQPPASGRCRSSPGPRPASGRLFALPPRRLLVSRSRPSPLTLAGAGGGGNKFAFAARARRAAARAGVLYRYIPLERLSARG